MAYIIPTEIKLEKQLVDMSGHPLTLAYIGPNEFGGPFAIFYGLEIEDVMHGERFTAEDIEGVLADGRDVPGEPNLLKINW